jgi:Flp pilus assembly protein TadD
VTDPIESLQSSAAEHLQAGRLEDAKQLYLRILALDVRHAPSLYGLGMIARQAGNFQVAASMIRRAIAADEKCANYHFGLGDALQAAGRHEEALSAFRIALDLDPAAIRARFRVGNLLQLEGRLDEATAEYERILEVKRDSADAEFNIGNIFRLQGRFSEARERYLRALSIETKNVDALWNLSLLDLLEGKYAMGWPRYEARHRRQVHGLRSFAQPQWKGEPLNGARILLHAEQGLGDTLQFLRYVPMVADAGGHVLVDVPKSIWRLAAGLPGVSAVVPSGEAFPEFDWQCPLMSLPLAFGTTVETIPARTPYLSVPSDAARLAETLPWPQRGLRVGLVWGAVPRQFEDSDRSIPLSQLEPLLRIEGVHFYSLQLGPPAAQVDEFPGTITDLGGAIGDFADTAALVSHLDLVITVDTSVAHVAGALARPTWVLLPFSADWRWLIGRDDSPWYPTVRLFRQPRPRDWQAVVRLLLPELASMAMKERR